MPIADDADRHFRQFLAGQVGAIEIASPFAAQRVVAARDEPRLGEDGADREFGDGGGISSRRVDDENFALARRVHVDIDRAAARDRNQLQMGQPVEHRGGERREMGDDDLRVVRRSATTSSGVALIFLQPVHARLGVAVLHRLVGPGHLERLISSVSPQCGRMRLLEHRRQHETVADDRDLIGLSRRALSWRVLLSEPAEMTPSGCHRLASVR